MIMNTRDYIDERWRIVTTAADDYGVTDAANYGNINTINIFPLLWNQSSYSNSTFWKYLYLVDVS